MLSRSKAFIPVARLRHLQMEPSTRNMMYTSLTSGNGYNLRRHDLAHRHLPLIRTFAAKPTLKSILSKLQKSKKPSTTEISSENASNPTDMPIPGSKNSSLGQRLDEPAKPMMKNFTVDKDKIVNGSPSGLGGAGSSIRDSFRRMESERVKVKGNSHTNHYNKSNNTRNDDSNFSSRHRNQPNNGKYIQGARGLNPNTLHHMNNHGNVHMHRPRAADEIDAAAVARGDVQLGDKRYSRVEQNKRYQRKEFERKFGLDGEGAGGEGATSRKTAAEGDGTVLDVAEMRRQLEQRMGSRRDNAGTGSRSNSYNSNNYTGGGKRVPATVVREVTLANEGVTVRDLASKLSMRIPEVVARLRDMGEDLPDNNNNNNSRNKSNSNADGPVEERLIDADTAELMVLDLGLGIATKRVSDKVALRTAVLTERPSMQSAAAGEAGAGAGAVVVGGEAVTLRTRSPVVCVMGHVDHGKTTLLDALRSMDFTGSAGAAAGGKTKKKKASDTKKSKAKKSTGRDSSSGGAGGASMLDGDAVAGTEAGGITQKLSAFSVQMGEATTAHNSIDLSSDNSNNNSTSNNDSTSSSDGGNGLNRRVMFLDTPGHAAFSAMRSHGAVATDLVVLVVAMDDGVRPQTIEALQMAQEANCGIIVAMNKMDKIPVEERAEKRARILGQLMEHGLAVEEFGGDVQVAEVAGRTGEGLAELVERILLQAEMMAETDLQASFEGQAEAVVLDARMDKGRGVVAELLVRWGALHVGDAVVVGGSYGKVKSLMDDKGRSVRAALPSDSVRLVGLKSLPSTGQEMLSVESETIAREIAERRLQEHANKRAREEELAQRRAAVLTQQQQEQEQQIGESGKEGGGLGGSTIHVVLKADGVGTLEALRQIVMGIAARAIDDIDVEIVGASVGDVNYSDIEIASSGGDAIVLGFNVGIVDNATRAAAKQLDVPIHRDNVIYRLEDELVRKMLDYLPKERKLHVEGRALVQQVFNLSGSRKAIVAGLLVQEGKMRTLAGNSSNNSTTGSGGGGGSASEFVFRVLRANGDVVLAESRGAPDLKRFKDSVHEVEAGAECGLSLDGFAEYRVGDVVECLAVHWTAPTQAIRPGVSGALQIEALTSAVSVSAAATDSSSSLSSSSSDAASVSNHASNSI